LKKITSSTLTRVCSRNSSPPRAPPFVCAICSDNRIWRYIDGRVHAHRHPHSRLCVSVCTLAHRHQSGIKLFGVPQVAYGIKEEPTHRAARAPSPLDDAAAAEGLGREHLWGHPRGSGLFLSLWDAVMLLIIHIRTQKTFNSACHNERRDCEKLNASAVAVMIRLKSGNKFSSFAPRGICVLLMLNCPWVCLNSSLEPLRNVWSGNNKINGRPFL
jgi:hypothetical protein